MFVGLDVSLTNSGFCALDDRGEIACIKSVTSEPTGSTVVQRFDRYRRIARKLWKSTEFATGKVTAVAIENYSYNSKGRIIQLAENGTLIRYLLLKKNVDPIIEVAPIQLKKYILGKVKGKGKNLKNVMCREVFRKFNNIIDDDNQVDAFVLAHIARDYWRHLRGKKPGKSKLFGKPQAEVLLKLLQKHGG